jgi:hypothetical protein
MGPPFTRRALHQKACASISRVLYPPCGGPPSSIWPLCHQRDRATYPPAPSCFGGTGFPCSCISEPPVYMVFQHVGFTKPYRSHGMLVSSYLTFSSLPSRSLGIRRSPFLRHFPWWRRPQRHPFPLGSTLPYAARTFLPPPIAGSDGAMHRMSRNIPHAQRVRWMITSVAPTP